MFNKLKSFFKKPVQKIKEFTDMEEHVSFCDPIDKQEIFNKSKDLNSFIKNVNESNL